MKYLLFSAIALTSLISVSLVSADSYSSSRSRQSVDQNTTSDQGISKKIQEILNSDSFSQGFQDVSFDVRNGYVTLSGSVSSIENKNKLEDRVRTLDGVKQVNNRITVPQRNPNATVEY